MVVPGMPKAGTKCSVALLTLHPLKPETCAALVREDTPLPLQCMNRDVWIRILVPKTTEVTAVYGINRERISKLVVSTMMQILMLRKCAARVVEVNTEKGLELVTPTGELELAANAQDILALSIRNRSRTNSSSIEKQIPCENQSYRYYVVVKHQNPPHDHYQDIILAN